MDPNALIAIAIATVVVLFFLMISKGLRTFLLDITRVVFGKRDAVEIPEIRTPQGPSVGGKSPQTEQLHKDETVKIAVEKTQSASDRQDFDRIARQFADEQRSTIRAGNKRVNVDPVIEDKGPSP